MWDHDKCFYFMLAPSRRTPLATDRSSRAGVAALFVLRCFLIALLRDHCFRPSSLSLSLTTCCISHADVCYNSQFRQFSPRRQQKIALTHVCGATREPRRRQFPSFVYLAGLHSVTAAYILAKSGSKKQRTSICVRAFGCVNVFCELAARRG